MTDLLGKTIGEYQLIELIHQGQNTIYKGFQPSMNRYVAVKILRQSLAADPTFVQQFHQDMERIAGLEHPNVLRIYDYGQQDGLLYIVTQYVETGSLKDRLPPAMSLQGAQAMINPIAQALDYLHARSIVHGNLKPSNILIDSQGQPLLADLGYSQGIDVAGRENVYLSPEQAQGAFADQRTDVYALGVLLYEMLIAEPPAVGVTPSPRLKRPDLPVEVEKVILKAMAQYPDQRFQTPGALRNALNMALTPAATPAAAPEPAPPPQAPPPSQAPAPRRGPSWVLILLVGLIVLCLVAVCGVGVFGVLGGQPAAPEPTATAAPGGEQPAPEPTPPSQPDGSIIQGLFDMIKSIFDSIVSIIDSIVGGGSRPEPPPEGQPTPPPPEEPPAQPPPEEPPPAEQLPAEPEQQ